MENLNASVCHWWHNHTKGISSFDFFTFFVVKKKKKFLWPYWDILQRQDLP